MPETPDPARLAAQLLSEIEGALMRDAVVRPHFWVVVEDADGMKLAEARRTWLEELATVLRPLPSALPSAPSEAAVLAAEESLSELRRRWEQMRMARPPMAGVALDWWLDAYEAALRAADGGTP